MSSDISQIAHLSPGEALRVSESTYLCLEIGEKMEQATGGAFSVTPTALKTQPVAPRLQSTIRLFPYMNSTRQWSELDTILVLSSCRLSAEMRGAKSFNSRSRRN